MQHLTQEKFRELLNSTFDVVGENGEALQFILTSVKDLGSIPRQEQFSLEFKGPTEPKLPQRMYEFSHETVGEFILFIVPIRNDGDVVVYESIFNRFIEEK